MTRRQRLAAGWQSLRLTLSRGSHAKDRRATAIHEAGHAVIGEYLGARILWLKLHPEHGRNGEVHSERSGVRKRDPILAVCSALAGHEAEHRVYARPLSKLPLGDWQHVMASGVPTGSRSLSLAGWLTRQLVRQHERPIRRVARALLERGSLNRRQFLAALKAPR